MGYKPYIENYGLNRKYANAIGAGVGVMAEANSFA